MELIDKQRYIFGSIFLIANKLQAIGDQYFGKDGLTVKQWFLTVMISQFGDSPPTLSEVSDLMGSSRQNVKQIALKLEEKDFLKIEKDQFDARALRLRITEKSRLFWGKRQSADDKLIEELFKNFSQDEINTIAEGFSKLHDGIGIIEELVMKKGEILE